MRRVASMGMPTCRGADEAKKKPPRETFRASVKCSVLSAATPSARKRRGVRRLRRVNCRRSATFILCPCATRYLARTLANSVKGISSVAELAGRSSIKLGVAKKYQYRPKVPAVSNQPRGRSRHRHAIINRKSTRLNSSHGYISYAVFCLKKKKTHVPTYPQSRAGRKSYCTSYESLHPQDSRILPAASTR